MRNCLKRLGFPFSERKHYSEKADNWNGRRFTIHAIQLAEFIRNYPVQGLPPQLKNLSKRQIGILLNSFFYGNGDFHGKRRLYVRPHKKLADTIQELVLKYGNSSNARKVGNMYVVTIGKDKVHKLETYNQPVKQIFDELDAYSIIVPGGLIFVRRNGKCCWVGN